ncbi:DUF2490 domain-containing protein [Dokdonia sinensis]|uniref:DUF2490 domain-containing protein n=1 Tax=Dokdonia sinensis TaxID=2479847 RepID=A0A3M0G1Z6_9FLAO|nr:DUF2490 domain-containing protein [Dokdonia sinensis]RMB58598.1 DUF2490 domain-containing protein [Dokdonia sinensis]
MRKILLLLLLFLMIGQVKAQVDQSQTGAWYMYFFNKQFDNNQFGIQGDVQYRNWNLGGDLEQLLIRTGLTYTPEKSNVLLTLGYANITSGAFGESDNRTSENRIYQEALLPHKVGSRILLTHRFRYEQRFVEDQDFRTRYRYNLFLNIPLNSEALDKNTFYAALYNEIFINSQTDIGDNREVQIFDRNRTYLGAGYVIKQGMRVQLGWMHQESVNIGKGQLQFSFHHNF